MNTLSRRAFLKVLTIISSLSLISKCSHIVEPLTIASHVWSGYELMFLARHEGWLSENSVQFLETLSATDSIQALLDGRVYGAALTLDEVLRARAQAIPLTCVLVFDVSTGADMVLSKTEIMNLSDLKGKRIGFEASALGALMLHKLLEAAQLEKSDIVPIKVNYDQHIVAWNQGKVDAVITFEPIASQLLDQGAHKIFDSRKIPDTILDVLAIKSDILKTHHNHIKSLIAAHFRARRYFYQNPQDAIYKMAVRMKIPADEVLNSFRGLNLPNEQANLKYLSSDQGTLLVAARNLCTLMVETGMLKQADSLDNLFTADFLPKDF
ncbi:hypothetical protein BAC3_01128 [uncultured bacterium]|nr:hypothetical protein BAC3_01128 [uncultured bacterium]